jgi:hypothetical protein
MSKLSGETCLAGLNITTAHTSYNSGNTECGWRFMMSRRRANETNPVLSAYQSRDIVVEDVSETEEEEPTNFERVRLVNTSNKSLH